MHTAIPASLQANAEWVDLYQRLQAFQVNSYEDAPLAFLHKLARMNGWTPAYTERVFTEYKRFLFLTVVAGHFVCPCEAVDQTWHFHLIYTQSYWNDLCDNVLGKALHHIPSRGGLAESNAFHREYAQTLTSYAQFFGEQPPADIWERPGERLRDTPHLRLMNTRTHWLLPRPTSLPVWTRGWVGKSLLGLSAIILTLPETVQAAESSSQDNSGWMVLFPLLFMFYLMARDPKSCLLSILTLLAWVVSMALLVNVLGDFGFFLGFIGMIAYSFWSAGRCPECRTRQVFHSTGVRSDNGEQVEYRCSHCGHTAWQASSQSSVDVDGGGCGGGCGGSGG